MFFCPQKECAARGDNRLYREIKILSLDTTYCLPEQRNASLISRELMCFYYVMVANASHSELGSLRGEPKRILTFTFTLLTFLDIFVLLSPASASRWRNPI